MTVYYNEIEPTAAIWLQASMDEGIIAKGDIDTRSIEDVKPNELIGYTQCHFFAGIGGWSIALRLAGWPDDKPVWTGSCPCQPFSTAGKGAGVNDPRHLWPAWFWLIQQCKPDTVFGEQVANAVTKGWLDDVAHDLENEGYAVGSAIIPACSVGAPHKRDRLWFVADTANERAIWGDNCDTRCSVPNPEQHKKSQNGAANAVKADGLCSCSGDVGNAESLRGNQGFENARGGLERSDARQIAEPEFPSDKLVANTLSVGQPGQGAFRQSIGAAADSYRQANRFDDYSKIDWYACPDGKARPVKSGLCLLADGIPAKLRKAALHGYGNAIVPEVASEFIQAATQG